MSAGAAETPSPQAAVAGPGPWAYVRVEDNGQGIAPDRLTAIFEPFEQADAEHMLPQEGSGLGLSISRRLARLMGGDLTVRSQLGRGSAFFLRLPGADGPLAAAEQFSHDRQESRTMGRAGRLHLAFGWISAIARILQAFC